MGDVGAGARPPALGLRHVALTVADLEACERFYVDVLGFVVEWRPDPDNLYLRLAGDNLALHRYEPPAQAADPGSDEAAFRGRRGQHLAHFGILVKRPEEVDAWAAHLRAHGVAAPDPRTHRDGARSFYVADPDGNAIQFLYHPPISDPGSDPGSDPAAPAAP
jgi:catechol 2,3-dioxygenase-like lactoylglutathione lyase family enzyme